jgi:hypothetical protein
MGEVDERSTLGCMLGRRFLLLVAVLMGLTALAASIAPREPLIRDQARRAVTPTPTPSPTAAATTPLRNVRRTLVITAEPGRIVVRQGDVVQLTVKGIELDSVSVLDRIEPIERQSPALFDLLADKPGQYPIELVDAGRRVGTLVVRAAD